MKFKYDCNINDLNCKDFITLIFVIVDDIYKKVVPESVKNRRNRDKLKTSDFEIITIAICGEIIGCDCENSWFSFIKKNHTDLFPNLCHRTRFNRLRRALLQTINLIFTHLVSEFLENEINNICIADSFPLEVCKFGRAKYCKSFREDDARYGICPSKKETYFGFKINVLATDSGFIKNFYVTPANVDDRVGLLDMLEDSEQSSIIIADKGYSGKKIEEELKEKGHILLALQKKNTKQQFDEKTRQLIFKIRRRIETTFSQLTCQFNAEKVYAKIKNGLYTRLITKFLAFNLCLFINKLFGIKNIARIKQLVF